MKNIGAIATALVYFWSTFAFAINGLASIEDLYLEDWAIIVSIIMPIVTFLVNLFYKKKYMDHIKERDMREIEEVTNELENNE